MINPVDFHRHFMRFAYQQAERAFANKEVPVGAIIMKDGYVIGKGYNQVEQLKDPSAHAEMIAISSACNTLQSKYLTGCTMYVTLEPCPMCAGALMWSKIDRIVFGAIDEKAGSCGSILNVTQNPNLNHKIEIIQGIMEDECAQLLKDFFASKREA